MKKTSVISIYLLFFICLLQITIPFIAFGQNQSKTDSLISVLKTAGEDSNKIRILNHLSASLISSEPDKSLDYARQMLVLAQKLDLKKYIITAYQNIGAYYYYRSDDSLAREYFEKELSVCEQTNNRLILGGVYGNLSLLATKQNDYPGAINYSDKAMQIAEEMKDSLGLATNLSNRAIIYLNISDFPSALNYQLKALRINERIKDKSDIANNYYFIGYTYMHENDYDKAINYFQLSLNAAKIANDRFQLSQTMDRIGEVYQHKKDWVRALDYFQQAIAIGREVGSFDNIISGTQNIAMIYNEQGKYDEAIQSLSNALELSNQLGDKMTIGNNYGYFGEIYMKKKDYKTAIPYFEKSVAIAREIKVKDNEAHELKNLAACYQALNNFKLQADYLVQYQAVRDSFMNEETIKKTAETDAKYQLDKKEKEIALLTKNKEIQTLEIKRQTFLKNSFIAGSAFLCLLFFLVYRNYRTRQLLKMQTLRNKIAIDLHDDIGSTLSSISVFSLMARQQSKEVIPLLDQIGEYSRKMLDSMADIVWAINPENDNFGKIVIRMRSFAFELMRAKNIDYKFAVDESVADLKLSMDVRKNLYLIFKEATNNIIKYSETDSALFSITRSKNNLTMLIRDKGKGFDLNNQTQGNGLKNMKIRASSIGAEFLIESEPGKGTTIQLLIKAA